MSLRILSVFGLSTTLLVGSAQALVLTYSTSAIGAGVLNGQAFSGRYTLSTVADSASVTNPSAGLFAVANAPTTVTVETANGLLSDTFIHSIRLASIQGTRRGGFSDMTSNLALMLVSNNGFGAYDLKSAAGPLSGAVITNLGDPFATTGGFFRIDLSFGGAFTAAPVPEPLSCVALGLGALALVRRRRAAK